MALVGIAFTVIALFSPTAEEQTQEKFAALQAQGLYPLLSEASDDDVRRLLQAGHRIFAIRLYRELHQVSLKDAVQAVKQMG